MTVRLQGSGSIGSSDSTRIVYPHARLLPARTRAFVEFAREHIHQFRAHG